SDGLANRPTNPTCASAPLPSISPPGLARRHGVVCNFPTCSRAPRPPREHALPTHNPYAETRLMSLLPLLSSPRCRLALLTLPLPLAPLPLLPATRQLQSDEPKSAPRLEVKPGDHICIIGNTLADRMQHDGWLETYLYSRFPKSDLVIRNLG